MSNSTTPVSGGVRPRTPAAMAAYWAEKAKNIPTQEGSRSLRSNTEPTIVSIKKDPEIQISKCFKETDLEKPFKYTGPADPDGLNEQIIGKFAKVLKHDDHLLQARLWKCHPATLTAAIKRMGLEWVQKQIEFVSGEKQVKLKGHYLAKLLAKNPY